MAPPHLAARVSQVWGDEGRRWLTSFPELLRAVASKWGLDCIQPAADLSYNYVAYAQRGGEKVVLKMAVIPGHLASEARALVALKSIRTARLIDFDAEIGALLLERIDPGESLWSTWSPRVDDEQTLIAAQLIAGQEVAAHDEFPTTRDWFEAFDRGRRSPGLLSRMDNGMLDRAKGLGAELHADGGQEISLLHGDFHHGNILSSGQLWKTIDPKGVMGERAFEVGAFLRNPADRILGVSDLPGLLERRRHIFSHVLGVDLERLTAWCFCACVLSACWSAVDNEPDDVSLACAAILER